MADVSARPIRDANGVITGWIVRWREDGRRPGRSFGPNDKALAERFASEKRAAQVGKTRRPRARKQPGGGTLADYFTTGYGSKIGQSRTSKRTVTASTRESRENAWKHWIEPNLGQMPIRNITPADVEGLLKLITHAGLGPDGKFARDVDGDIVLPHPSWTNGLGAATKCRNLLKDIFFYAQRDGIVDTNPCENVYIELAEKQVDTEEDTDSAGVLNEIDDEDVAAGSIRIWFSEHEVQLLVKGASTRDKLIIRTLATLGMRIGELAALRVEDFDAEKGQLIVRSTLSTKPKRLQRGVGAVRKSTKTDAGRRRINLPSKLAADFSSLCADRPGSAAMFVGPRGGILRPDNFRNRNWARALSKSGIDGHITPHDLRHFAASKMLGDGVDIAVVSRMLGHANVGITDKLYRHLMPDHANDAAIYWDRPENDLGSTT